MIPLGECLPLSRCGWPPPSRSAASPPLCCAAGHTSLQPHRELLAQRAQHGALHALDRRRHGRLDLLVQRRPHLLQLSHLHRWGGGERGKPGTLATARVTPFNRCMVTGISAAAGGRVCMCVGTAAGGVHALCAAPGP